MQEITKIIEVIYLTIGKRAFVFYERENEGEYKFTSL